MIYIKKGLFPEPAPETASLLLRSFIGIAIQLLIRQLLLNHAVDVSPIGQTTQVAVVNEEVRFHLAREAVMGGILFGIVPVDGIKLHAPFPAPFHGLVQQLSFTYGPPIR